MKTVLAWHFCRADMRTQYTEERILVGGTLTANGRLALCENGMHASERVVDALRYAPGATLCRVELSGRILHGDDKLCARHRRAIAMADVTPQLREFALLCAERVLPSYEKRFPGDTRVRECIATTRRYLAGQAATAEDLLASRQAAHAAAADAAADAAAAAADAYATYVAAAADATYDAAYAAAADAAYADAAYATYVAAREKALQKQAEIIRMILEP